MKKILISVSELNCGGTEIAMINLLKNLDMKNYEITLLLARKRGVYLQRIPKHVKIIEIPFINEYERYHISNDFSLVKSKKQAVFIKIIRKVLSKLDRNIKRINYKADIYYNYLLKKTNILEENYDLAIDFLGYGYFQSAYIAEKISAKNKIMWIHDEKLEAISRCRCYFEKYTYFFGVSKSCARLFKEKFPETKNRVGVFYNYIDEDEIVNKSKESIDRYILSKKNFNIVTVGRLEWQKGYDLAIDVAKKLKENGVKFHWYVLGDGSCRDELKKSIKYYGLEKEFILIGRVDNPYPYIKNASLYIQTSRHEGYGLAIAEARVLNKCIVSTDLECVREQIINGKTGYLVSYDVNEFFKLILNLYNNRDLIRNIEKNLEGKIESYKQEVIKLEPFI